MIELAQESEETAGTRIEPGEAYGFFTDTTICIGCKACEVACKQWNQLPAEESELTGLSYDNTRSFSSTTWRHVRFIEQMDEERFDGPEGDPADEPLPEGQPRSRELRSVEDLGRLQVSRSDPAEPPEPARPPSSAPGVPTGAEPPGGLENFPAEVEPWGHFVGGEAWSDPGQRWLLMSDVCKHCVDAPCQEACPTGSIIRTEFDSVLVQQDICNGCGYCQSACPFGVVQVDKEGDGKAHKCTLCYDRLKDGMEPACAKACPTDSIQFGRVDELKDRAQVRVAEMRNRGIDAYIYGDPDAEADRSRQRSAAADRAAPAESATGAADGAGVADTSEINGLNCFFLLIDDPEVYNLPPRPPRPSRHTPKGLLTGLLTAAALTATTMLAFRGGDA